MTAEVPEIKLVNRKNTLITRHCVGQTFVYCRKATPLQQKCNLYTLFSAGAKGKINKLRNFSFVFKLYFSSTFNYVQLNYKFLSLTSFRLPGWRCHAFLQERIQKSSPRAGRKACVILGGRAQRDVFPFTQEKNGGIVQKMKNNDYWCTSTWNENQVICVFAMGHTDVTQCQSMSVIDTTLTTQFSFLFYCHRSYYNKYFVRYLQIKSSLVLITNYSMANARNCVKDTTLTQYFFFSFIFIGLITTSNL